MKHSEEKQNETQKRVLARVLAEELKVTTGGSVWITGPAQGTLNGSDITDGGANDTENQY